MSQHLKLFELLLFVNFYFLFKFLGLSPKFRRPIIADRIAFINESLKLLCKVKGKPEPFVVWFFDEKPIKSSER